jgi:REP element-mobilizing transposase RayT
MPRQGRLHIDGGYYHVMGRGLERRHIFSGVDDKTDFLERLGTGLEQTDSECLAFAVMSNHYHLLIRVSSAPLSHLMSKLLSGYATHYNHRNKRSGYVFQNRFKSILCDADNYLLELIRYIHLNPVKANLVDSLTKLDRYRWTGHAGIMGKHKQSWHNQKAVLQLFGPQRKQARECYRAFIKAGINNGIYDADLSGGGLVRSYGGWETVRDLRQEHKVRIGDERILGDSDFVTAVLKKDILAINKKTHWQLQGWNLKKLVNIVCDYFEVPPSDLKQRSRQNALSNAKSVICYLSIHELGLSSTEIAKYIVMSQPAISKAAKRGGLYCQQYKIECEIFGIS